MNQSAAQAAERDALLGPSTAAVMLVGALLALAQARLPSITVSTALALLGATFWLAGYWRRGVWRWPGLLLFGFAWTALFGQAAMQARMPVESQGVDQTLRGLVVDLPSQDAARTRFDFIVDADAPMLAGAKVRLGWYGSVPSLQPGSHWQLRVRLRRPRGVANPGGFDFERYALQRGIAASGYVRASSDNQLLAEGGGIDALRERLSRQIGDIIGMPRARFVQALAVGDTRHLDDHDWAVLRATGIAHLIAISGLHVGLVAGFGVLLMRLLYRLWPVVGLRLPLPQAAAVAALLAAAGYTALAGFALPTVRTLLMIGVVLLAVLLRRPVRAWQSFALALWVVLLIDPLALLGAGFWLSFLGVAWLLWCLPHARHQHGWRVLLRAQGVMSLSLLPLTVWFFGQASMIGPLANLIAVPWVSFVVVPLALIGTALLAISESLAAVFLQLAELLMRGLWMLLEPAAGLHGALVYLPQPGVLAFVLALLAAFWLLLPRGVPGKSLAVLLFLPLLLPAQRRLPDGEVELWLLDVGQGLSVLLRTREHALLFDAGPAFPHGLDQGEASVVPALRALGVADLDVYVESHGDNDHAGGSAAVLRAYAPPRVYASSPKRQPHWDCRRGVAWQWNGVHFEFLHPPLHFPYLGNDSSCVLRIEAAGHVALLPGDISSDIEARLLREQASALRADVLLSPHHGSAGSSSAGFVDSVSPQWVLIGAGYRNRFDLPRPQVLQRYRDAGANVLNTAETGAIHLRLGAAGVSDVHDWRGESAHFWRESVQ